MSTHKNYKIFLIAFLIGITIFSVFKYLAFLKEKYDLLNTLNKIKVEVATLRDEKQNLLQALEKEKQLQQQINAENAGLKENLKASQDELNKLNAELAETKEAIEQLDSELVALKTESVALKEERDNLNFQLVRVTEEKESLKTKLSSLPELRKAIKELKIQMRKAHQEARRKSRGENLIEGNRGFLIKDGRSTYPSKVKIEVIPAGQE